MSTGPLIPPEILRQLQTMGHSRFELVMVEAEEVRDRVQHLLGLGLVLLVFAVLAVLCLNAALVVALWSLGPVVVLLTTGAVWSIIAILIYWYVFSSLRRWRPFAASYDQLRKDRTLIMEHMP